MIRCHGYIKYDHDIIVLLRLPGNQFQIKLVSSTQQKTTWSSSNNIIGAWKYHVTTSRMATMTIKGQSVSPSGIGHGIILKASKVKVTYVWVSWNTNHCSECYSLGFLLNLISWPVRIFMFWCKGTDDLLVPSAGRSGTIYYPLMWGPLPPNVRPIFKKFTPFGVPLKGSI
jgi:hypothetical protein